MRVKYSYLEEQFAEPGPILEGIERLVRSTDFTLGEPVEQFEEKFAAAIGTRYAIGVNSGTDALFLSLKAAGVKPGDEVITSPNTFIATVGAIVAAGAKPAFVDIIEDDFTIDPDLIEAAITPRTSAIMPVHYAGHPAEMSRVLEIAERRGLAVIEDACQAIGAEIDGRRVGTFGLSAGFSLHPLKNLNVWGDGGVVVTDSEAVRDKLILLRNHGLADRDTITCFGYNSRLDSLQAVVGLHLIGDLEAITEARIKWANRYDEGLADLGEHITIPPRKSGRRYVYHLYMLIVTDRDALLKHLIGAGVEAKIHYPIPLHLQEAASDLGYKRGDFPITEAQAGSIVSLPVHQHLTGEQVEYVIETIRAFYS